MAVQFAVRLALLAFAATSLVGLIAGGDLVGVIQFALFRVVAFYVTGLLCGGVAERLMDEQANGDFARWIDSLKAAEAASESGV